MSLCQAVMKEEYCGQSEAVDELGRNASPERAVHVADEKKESRSDMKYKKKQNKTIEHDWQPPITQYTLCISEDHVTTRTVCV